MNFNSKKPHYEHLRKKWTAKHRSLQDKLLGDHGVALRQVAVGSLGGLMLMATPGGLLPTHQLLTDGGQITSDSDNNVQLAGQLEGKVPQEMRPLTDDEEKQISEVLTKNFGVRVTPELEGIRLNRSYGLIGGEQHLYRFPEDNLYKHADNLSDSAMYTPAGIAPGLGAWGYFAPSEAQFSEKDKMRERYYLAVQTFLAPGFAENTARYRDFFKYRKILVVNPKTGQAVVADIADAGPAQWTGKHLGGSPEVMHFIGLAEGPRKGAVLYFFINDSKDEVPLGPVKWQSTSSKIAGRI